MACLHQTKSDELQGYGLILRVKDVESRAELDQHARQ